VYGRSFGGRARGTLLGRNRDSYRGGRRAPPSPAEHGCGRAPAPAWIWLPESLLQMQAEWMDSGTQEQRGEDSSGELKPRIGTAPGKILELRFLSESRPPPIPAFFQKSFLSVLNHFNHSQKGTLSRVVPLGKVMGE